MLLLDDADAGVLSPFLSVSTVDLRDDLRWNSLNGILFDFDDQLKPKRELEQTATGSKMPDRTREFKEAATASSSSSSSAAAAQTPARTEALRKLRKRKRANEQQIDPNDPDVDVWSFEAARIVDSLRNLTLFLSGIRRAYLDLSSSHNQYRLSKGKSASGVREDLDLSKGLLEAWKDVKWLNDRERDEVDWQAKDMLRKCMERLKALEQAEKSMCCSHSSVSKLMSSPARSPRESETATRHQPCQQFYTLPRSTSSTLKSSRAGRRPAQRASAAGNPVPQQATCRCGSHTARAAGDPRCASVGEAEYVDRVCCSCQPSSRTSRQ